MRRAALVAIMAAVYVACGGSGGGHTITGTMDLRVPDGLKTLRPYKPTEFAVGGPCKASEWSGGYADLDEGSSVVVKNEKDTVIATGHLGAGHWTQDSCETPLSVPGVPDANFYSVEVGHRGAQRYSRAELAAKKWTVSLSVTDISP